MWLHSEYSDTRDGRGAGGKWSMLQSYLLFWQSLVSRDEGCGVGNWGGGGYCSPVMVFFCVSVDVGVGDGVGVDDGVDVGACGC